MKKVYYILKIAIITIFFLLINLGNDMQVLAETEKQMYVVGSVKTNVREGGSTEYDVITQLYGNTEVTQLYTIGSWSYIRYGEDEYGYISTDRLAAKPENMTGSSKQVAVAKMTLYAEPTTSCQERLVLNYGTEVEDRGVYFKSDFNVISYAGKTWYLYDADSKIAEDITETEKQMYVVGSVKTNVREGGSTEYDVITQLYGNTEVTQLYTSGSWSYIRYGEDEYGYISTDRLAAKPENMTGSSKQVAVAKMTLYAEPTTSCQERLVLNYGTEVEDRGVYFKSDFNVISYAGKIWYLYGAEGKLAENGTIDVPEVNVKKYVADLYVTLHKEMDADSEFVRAPYRSEVIYLGDEYISSEGKWSKIEYEGSVWYMWQSNEESDKLTSTKGTLSYSSDNQYAQEILDVAVDFYANKETEYRFGESSGIPDENGVYGFDCSGFITYVYKTVMTKYVPTFNFVANSLSMYELQYLYNEGLNGEAVVQDISIDSIEPGDIIFMHLEEESDGSTEDLNKPNHVGIYLGNNEFIHCTYYEWGTGVFISPMNNLYSDSIIAVRRFVPDKVEPAETQMYVTSAFSVNVHSEASAESTTIAKLYGNTEVVVLFTSEWWAYVRYDGDQYGFIDVSRLASTPENMTGTRKLVSASQITLYAEPSTSCEEKITLGYGTEVEDRGIYYNSDFNVINYDGKLWYLYDADTKLSEELTEKQMYVVGAFRTNVRNGASATSEVVTMLYGNTKVTQLSISGAWAYIRYGNDQYGYISVDRLASTPENMTGTRKLVSASQITLYAEPSTSCEEKITLGYGTEVEDRGIYYNSDFNVISYGGETWYLYDADTKLSEELTEKQMYVVGSFRTNVRNGASATSEVVTMLYGNTKVTQLSISGAWAYIRYGNNQYGYISADRLASEPENMTGVEKVVSASQITLYAEPSTSCEEKITLSYGTEVEDRGTYYNSDFNVISYGGETWYLYDADAKITEKNN